MLLKPVREPHKIPVDTLAPILPFGTLFNLLEPFHRPTHDCLVRSVDSLLPRTEVIPVWHDWLEEWYKTCCPRFWRALEEDDAADLAALSELDECHDLQHAAGADEGDLEELVSEMHKLEDLRDERWRTVYALHDVRKQFLEYHSDPARSEEEILRAEMCRTMRDMRRPVAGPHSIWPTVSPQQDDGLFSPSSCPLHFRLTPTGPFTFRYWHQYCIPDVRTAASDREHLRRFGREADEPAPAPAPKAKRVGWWSSVFGSDSEGEETERKGR